MTIDEAKRKLDFMKKAYQKLIDEKVDNGRLVGKDVTGVWKAGVTLDEAYKSMIEALDMAIQALEQQPYEDYISREEAINRIEVRRKITCESDPYNYEEWTKGYEEGIDDAIAMINSIPPVTPQPKTGKWIAYTDHQACSCCGNWIAYYENDFNFCPYCGAKMEVGE